MENPENIHFLSIPDVITADLAACMKIAGHTITISDNQISDDIRGKLLKHNMIPPAEGWFTDKINPGVTVVIGNKVKADNPELKKAIEIKTTLYSLPEFIYERSRDKQRVVVAGSHGKTMIMSLIIHVLNFHDRQFDYVINAPVNGKATQARLSHAPLIIIEGQDVMASLIDPTPSFLKYHHHIAVISGIEWQQSESYPTREEYIRQFALFGSRTPKGGVIVYVDLAHVVAILSQAHQPDVLMVPYKIPASIVEDGKEFLLTTSRERLPLHITGKHNLQNISAAQETLKKVGVTAEMFYQAIPSFAPGTN